LASARREQPTYLRTDTHWTPHGARVAAATIAGALRRSFPGAHGTVATFHARLDGTREYRGDLFNFLPLDPYFGWLLPPAEPLVTTSTVKDDAAGGDLLGSAAAPAIALIGTSYSAEPQWDFAGALEQALQTDVGNYA